MAAEPIGAVASATEGLAGRMPNMDLQALTAASRLEEVQGARFSALAEQAISKAVERPEARAGADRMTDDLRGRGTGDVARTKDDMTSDISRPGTPEPTEADASHSAGEMQEDRIRTLYLDLTNYQIAWKIAQRLQQDVTQLMRGS